VLWESGGSPEGRLDELWENARALVERESPATDINSAEDKPEVML
jgi:hypothetical protein